MKEAIGQKKVPYKKMCINRFEENTTRYQNRKNQTKKAIADSRKNELTELNEKSKSIFKLVKDTKKMKKVLKEDTLTGKHGKVDFSKKTEEHGKIT